MSKIHIDLFKHQAWADAIHWKAFESLPSMFEDKKVLERLYHIHIVQHGYLSILGKRQFVYKKSEDFKTPDELKKYAQCFHEEIFNVIQAIPVENPGEVVSIPWFNDPPLSITVEEAMMQLIMHSQYHRGQNATRFRELGGDPPNTDFVTWLWKGCPAAEW
jgi:uncharacterized damage-inducible protein DinB